MSQPATAPAVEPTAIEPQRVLVLSDQEQRELIDLLAEADTTTATRLRNRIAYGDEYVNPIDELARTTLRKRRLEAEVRRANERIFTLDEIVVDELLQRGESAAKHAATGATLSLSKQIWAKVVRQGEKVTPEEKAAAGDALIRAGLGDFVRSDFNTNSVSAYFREQVTNYLEEQRALPEDERRPHPPIESFLPDELRGFIELTDKPTINVRA